MHHGALACTLAFTPVGGAPQPIETRPNRNIRALWNAIVSPGMISVEIKNVHAKQRAIHLILCMGAGVPIEEVLLDYGESAKREVFMIDACMIISFRWHDAEHTAKEFAIMFEAV